jgi:hypothetical protein
MSRSPLVQASATGVAGGGVGVGVGVAVDVEDGVGIRLDAAASVAGADGGTTRAVGALGEVGRCGITNTPSAAATAAAPRRAATSFRRMTTSR